MLYFRLSRFASSLHILKIERFFLLVFQDRILFFVVVFLSCCCSWYISEKMFFRFSLLTTSDLFNLMFAYIVM